MLQAAEVEEVLVALQEGARLVTTAGGASDAQPALPLPTPVLRGVLRWLAGFWGWRTASAA